MTRALHPLIASLGHPIIVVFVRTSTVRRVLLFLDSLPTNTLICIIRCAQCRVVQTACNGSNALVFHQQTVCHFCLCYLQSDHGHHNGTSHCTLTMLSSTDKDATQDVLTSDPKPNMVFTKFGDSSPMVDELRFVQSNSVSLCRNNNQIFPTVQLQS